MNVVKHRTDEYVISVGLFPATDMWVYHVMLLQFSVSTLVGTILIISVPVLQIYITTMVFYPLLLC